MVSFERVCFQEYMFQLVLTTDGITSLAIFTYQCSQEIAMHSSTVIGYSVNNELYRQHPVSNFTELACKNQPYSNFTNLVFQLNYGKSIKLAFVYIGSNLFFFRHSVASYYAY